MKNILGIICSKRKLGNSEISIKEISKRIATPHNLRLINLTDFEIDDCNACYSCISRNKDCVIKDDLKIIIDELILADAIILAVPTYFMTAHSSLLRLLDRFLTLYTYADKIWNKPAIGIGIAGMDGNFGSTETLIRLFLNVLMSDIKDIKMMNAAFPGEILTNEKNLKSINELANSLWGDKIIDNKPKCNLCGNNSFSFEGNNKIKCLICSNEGNLQIENENIRIDINRSISDIFLNKNSAMEHKQWLIEMKQKFFSELSNYKKIREEYKNYGTEVKKSS